MAFDESLNTRSIASNLENFEPARNSFFVFIVSDLDNLLKPNYKGEADAATANDKLAKGQEILKLAVTKCSVPSFSIDNQIDIRRGNDVVHFAGTPSFKDGSISIDDFVGLRSKDAILAWKELAYNSKTRKGGRAADYKKTCTLIEYTQDYQAIRTWTLEGCWVKSCSEEDFDKENDGMRKLSADIVYDRATYETAEY